MKATIRERSWCVLAAIFAVGCVFSTQAVQLVTVQGPSFAPQAGGDGMAQRASGQNGRVDWGLDKGRISKRSEQCISRITFWTNSYAN
jgi:hypothetical protein